MTICYPHKVGAIDGEVFGRVLAFTKEQLDFFKMQKNALDKLNRLERKTVKFTPIPFPKNEWYSVAMATDYLGVPDNWLNNNYKKYEWMTAHNIATGSDGKQPRGVIVFHVSDLDRLKKEVLSNNN